MPGSFNDPDQVTRELVIYYAIDNTKLHALQIASYSVGVEWHITCYQCEMCAEVPDVVLLLANQIHYMNSITFYSVP